jgi:arylsulfatase A-like enzyme
VPAIGDAQRIYHALPRSKWSGSMTTMGQYEARYDGTILRLDDAFKRLRALMEKRERFKNTTVVIVGSYGMSLGEGGLWLDSGGFCDSDLRVPLIVRPAAGIPALTNRASDTLVSTVDLMPTLLELAGVPPAIGMDGHSFLRALSSDWDESGRYIFASCDLQMGYAVLDKDFCYERTWPGRIRDSRLRESWFGDSDPRPDVPREVLHDRHRQSALDHLRLPELASDAKQLTLMRQAGERWASRVEAMRAVLQGERPASEVSVDAPVGR